MHAHSLLPFTLAVLFFTSAAEASCTPFYTRFGADSSLEEDQFRVVDGPNSYKLTSEGLQLLLYKPDGTIRRAGNVNDKVGEGVTVASMWDFTYGKLTYEVEAPDVPGVVTAMITMGTDTDDEIDVEILGSDPGNFQTNIFTPTKNDPDPHYATLFSIQPVPGGDVTETHKYTVDWREDRILWGVDGNEVMVVKKEQTVAKGMHHFPMHASRVQLGIWDASSPEGTSEWAGGPINWQKAPNPVVATVKSVRLECP